MVECGSPKPMTRVRFLPPLPKSLEKKFFLQRFCFGKESNLPTGRQAGRSVDKFRAEVRSARNAGERRQKRAGAAFGAAQGNEVRAGARTRRNSFLPCKKEKTRLRDIISSGFWFSLDRAGGYCGEFVRRGVLL